MASRRRLRRLSLFAALLASFAASGVAFAQERPAPRTVELTLTAAPARLSLVPGVPADILAFNGQVPGPTLEFREGDRVVIHFHNNLSVGGIPHGQRTEALSGGAAGSSPLRRRLSKHGPESLGAVLAFGRTSDG